MKDTASCCDKQNELRDSLQQNLDQLEQTASRAITKGVRRIVRPCLTRDSLPDASTGDRSILRAYQVVSTRETGYDAGYVRMVERTRRPRDRPMGVQRACTGHTYTLATATTTMLCGNRKPHATPAGCYQWERSAAHLFAYAQRIRRESLPGTHGNARCTTAPASLCSNTWPRIMRFCHRRFLAATRRTHTITYVCRFARTTAPGIQ